MKNIIEILKGIGIEVPEDKTADLNKELAENYKTVAEFDKVKQKLETERDGYKTQLDTAQEALKGFEGVDVAELNGKIKQLSDDLAKQDSDYKAKIADMEFMSVLDTAVAGSGARNAKAVKALLDMDALKASQNRDADIKTALETVKKENGYMFADAPDITTSARTGAMGGTGKTMTLAEAMAFKNAHPEADISKLISTNDGGKST